MIETLSGYMEILFTLFPPFTQSTIPFYVLNAFIFLIVFQSVRMIVHLLLNKQIALVTSAYSSPEGRARKILILGDSTAVGTGASSPDDTIAGKLAHDFPNSQIINLGKNGGRIRDLLTQIHTVKNEVFDMIIISAGGNDVWHFSNLSSIEKNLTDVLTEASRMSNNRVIFLLYNNIGSATIFPPIVQYFLKKRCARVQQRIQTVASECHIPTIDLFSQEAHNPFLQNPEELFANDGIHPSSRGYALWYHRMWLKMVQNGFHYE